MKVAITGIPGSGKTTLAAAVGAEFGLPVVSAGEIARRVSAGLLAEGRMADMRLLAQALMEALDPLPEWVLDGFPRTAAQYQLLDPDARLILLMCRHDIAVDRQTQRNREGDTAEIITRRTLEQAQLLEVGVRDGWAGVAAGYQATVNTSLKPAGMIARDVIAFLRGERLEAY